MRSALPVFHVKHILILFLIFTFVGTSGCVVSRSPVSGQKRAYAYSWEQEVQLGKESHAQIVQQFGLYDDPSLQQYVDRIGRKVLANSHLQRDGARAEYRNTEFTFTVLDSPVVNAFALPGGYIYVTRGLMTHLENEAQLAVVLGHEIAHVAARHASQQALEQQLGQVGLIGGAILGQEVLGLPAGDLLNLGSTAAQLLFLRYSRDNEEESDALGVQYAAFSGYKAEEGAKFFTSLKRLSEKEGQSIPTFMSTHPDPGSREQRIPKIAEEYVGRASMTEIGEQTYLRELEGTVLGENPRQGFTRNGIFYHPDLRFQFPVPRDFQVVNQPSQVALVQSNQQAVVLFSIANAASPQAAANTFASQQGIKVIDSGRARAATGTEAYYLVSEAQTQDGQTVRLLNYFIGYEGKVYSFLGYTSTSLFGNYQNQFQQVMQGFAPLTDRSILSIQPTKVAVAPASRTAPFSAFVPSTLPPNMTAQDLAILNQVDLNETIQRGDLLKLPAK